MQIAVISDTHRNTYELKKLKNIVKNIDIIIHLGDNVDDVNILKDGFNGKIINVRGNCDFVTSVPVEILEEIEGKKIFITHGHKYNVKYGLTNLKYRAEELEADIVLFGHTHESLVEYEKGIWFINPGSASLPRDFCKSIAILTIENNKIDVNLKKL
ncbi:hypothetical protein SAMN05428976_1043 [Clostridium sp. USBA 49]|jgi:hypothetical protein|uniref:metallophosphoesterase n=1 Tax=Clostridium TaxID=1485 RepID=UPI000999C016|nr:MULTISPECIES: metallophosphoesterase [Clostridium]SKA79748.1 hypothetical protein SAMN05428976_1043 [Clostridium sp. USBA 49]